MRLVEESCTAYAKLQVAKTMAEYTGDPEARAKHLDVARYWDAAGRALHRRIGETLDNALTVEVTVETFLPVQPLPTGEISLRAHDERHRPFVVRLTTAQALAVGTHLTAYAAIGIDRTGGKVAEALPPITAQPPYKPPAFAPRPGTGAIPAPGVPAAV
ncbi:hypothetical protein OHA72_47690 [Dactylosporangium sp. NBC_01737]|uniref:hypothetical protein n=1 Tax=Dactylosporangium sp. NBC_01737 TaxID=2975959 RepID=UPI002E0DC337|nr:hypothetical protein OHA72_47690 [Dactylosporangium sp. NBC_01737]